MTELRSRALRLAAFCHDAKARHRRARSVLEDGVRKILVVRPDHIGDVLLTTPALRLLREGFPNAEVTLMVGPWSAEVARRQPSVDRVAEARFPGFDRAAEVSLVRRYAGLFTLANRLRQERFDLAMVGRPDFWWGAWLVAAAGIPRRLGYALPDVQPFLSHALARPARRHAALDALYLSDAAVRRWGSPPVEQGTWRPGEPASTFPIRADDRHVATSLLSAAGADAGDSPVVFHVGSGTRVKRWPAQRWIELALVIRSSLNRNVVVCSGPSEHKDAVTVGTGAGVPVVAPPPSLGALGALFQRTSAVVGADSGAMHLAVAVRRPTVTLFGPADPVVYGPWGPRNRHAVVASSLICSPCDVLRWPDSQLRYHPCVRWLAVSDVLDALRRVLVAAESSDRLPVGQLEEEGRR